MATENKTEPKRSFLANWLLKLEGHLEEAPSTTTRSAQLAVTIDSDLEKGISALRGRYEQHEVMTRAQSYESMHAATTHMGAMVNNSAMRV